MPILRLYTDGACSGNQNEDNNINVPAGHYYILFNDIMGTYTFIAAE
jgi:hypothetical protein